MKTKYFSMSVADQVADIYIFGDITSWEWMESDVSSYTLAQRLAALDPAVGEINVHINSYGGEVSEGLAIYNTLRQSKAKVRTICEGFACSIASVIFMAGAERIMRPASMLMIHNAWMRAAGNAGELRKMADDLDAISAASIAAYMSGVTVERAELEAMLDAETWIAPADAVDKGFATATEDVPSAQADVIAASARDTVMQMIAARQDPAAYVQPVADAGSAGMPALTIYADDTNITIYDRDVAAQYVAEMLSGEVAGKHTIPENKTTKLFNALLGGKE